MSLGPLQAQQIFSYLRATLSHISLLQYVMVFFCILSCFQKFNIELKGFKKKSPIVSTSDLYLKIKMNRRKLSRDHKPSPYLIQSPSLLSRLGLTGIFYLAWLCPSMPLHALWRSLPLLVMVRAGHQDSAAARGYSAITWNMGIWMNE